MLRQDHLIRRIQTEFPELTILRSRLVEKGDDHAVVAINERLIFRFPRGRAYRRAFADELKIVAALKGRSPIPVPDYTFVAQDKAFGGYCLRHSMPETAASTARRLRRQLHAIVSLSAAIIAAIARRAHAHAAGGHGRGRSPCKPCALSMAR